MVTKFTSSKRGPKVDLASIALAGVAVVLILALILQFFLWLKVHYEHKTSVSTWEGVLLAATEKANRAEDAASKARTRAEEIHAETVSRFATVEASITSVRLSHEALDESVAHLNAKTAARERELVKAAKRDGRSTTRSNNNDSEPGEAESDRNTAQGDLLAALAEQQARATESNNKKPQNGFQRLVPRR